MILKTKERVLLDESKFNNPRFKKPLLEAPALLLEMDTESKIKLQKIIKDPNIPIYMNGPIQYGDKINRNRRKYPWEYLKKECIRYMEEEVKDGQSYGECVTSDHFILTNQGWKSIVDVKIGDIVATMNPISNELEYQPVLYKIAYKYSGEIYNMKSSNFSARVTPDHKFIVKETQKENKEFNFVYAKDLTYKHLIPKKCIWKGEKKDYIELEKNGKKLSIETKIFMQFLGWYLSEGWSSQSGFGISQAKKENFHIIDDIFINLGIKFSKTEKNGEITWFSYNKILTDFCSKCGKDAKEKRIPDEIKKLDSEYLKVLLHTLYSSNGSVTDYYTKSKQLCDDVSELIIKTGNHPSINKKQCYNNFYVLEDKTTKLVHTVSSIEYCTKDKYVLNKEKYEIINKFKEIKKDDFIYVIRNKTTKFYHLSNIEITKEPFNDMVYCVSVPNHTIYLMHNGKTFWSSNCDHPEEATSPRLQFASHTIEDIWFKGYEVYGRIKILNAFAGPDDVAMKVRSIILNKKTLGISSRSLGSLLEYDDYDEVCEDLSIICWDLVSRPSTHTANLQLEAKKFNQYKKYITESQYNKKSNHILLSDFEKTSLQILGVEDFLKVYKKY